MPEVFSSFHPLQNFYTDLLSEQPFWMLFFFVKFKNEVIDMYIRHATINDLKQIAAVEAECFNDAEAASEKSILSRLTMFPNHFWLMFDGDILVGFVNGMVTDRSDLEDEMYENSALHDENGKWQMIFGVCTVPSYRNHGCAGKILKTVIFDAKEQGREGLVLTCKEALIGFYEKFGFYDEGISESSHGGVVWHQMRLKF